MCLLQLYITQWFYRKLKIQFHISKLYRIQKVGNKAKFLIALTVTIKIDITLIIFLYEISKNMRKKNNKQTVIDILYIYI